MKEEQLSETERKLFDQLQREAESPVTLEQSVIGQLREEGLIKNESKVINMNSYIKSTISVAAAVMIFYIGIQFGKTSSDNPVDPEPDTEQMVQIDPSNGYMLILHEDSNFKPGDPMDMFNEYSAWMENTFARGVKITGQELKNEATIVMADQVRPTDNPERRTTGYFLLEASSMEEAVEVAKENPHVKYGGIVEVKEYMVR